MLRSGREMAHVCDLSRDARGGRRGSCVCVWRKGEKEHGGRNGHGMNGLEDAR